MRIRALIPVAALTAAVLILAGCTGSPTTQESSSTDADAAMTVQSAPERVDAARFAEVVEMPGVQIIDVRTPEEFATGHLDGAVNYDLQGSSFLEQVATLDPSGTYAVYCRSGNRSQPAVAAMADAGISSIYELSTGIIGWQDAGLPTVQ